MRRTPPVMASLVAVLGIIMILQCSSEGPLKESISFAPGGQPHAGAPWELVFTVDGQWATAIIPYKGKLYLGERDYMNHTAYVYESSDGENFTKVFDTQSDQIFIMGVNTLNDTLYIGTISRFGSDNGNLFYYDGNTFDNLPWGVWWNSSSDPVPSTPLSMHMHDGKFFVGGLSWNVVPESGNKMWVKYQNANGTWHWTDMSQGRLGSVIEAYSMEEYNGKLYVGTFEPAGVVVYDDASQMWNNSLTGVVDGTGTGNVGVIGLIDFDGKLHGLTWASGYHWTYDSVSWTGGNVSQHGGYGRAIEHNGTMYAGTTPFYGGIKPWTWSNISEFDGFTWMDVEPIPTITPSYFAMFQSHIYATAGRLVYRMDVNAPPPPITQPPTNLHAKLEGPGLANVNITWDPSTQDRFVMNYTVYHGDTFRRDKQGYQYLMELPKRTSHFVHSFAGHGDDQNHFYYVQANGTNSSAASVEQAGKFARDVSSGLQLISVPLEQQNDSIAAVFVTISYDRMWCYNGSMGNYGWSSYVAEKPWNVIDSLDFERGYWINVTSPGQLTVAGRVPESTVLHLYPGWNLISFPSFESYDVARVLSETGATKVEICDPVNPPYRLMEITGATTLVTGEAYWIQVPVGVNWLVT